MSSNGDCCVIGESLAWRYVPMHVPTCPVKMAGTLQRPCANCPVLAHYLRGLVFHGQARDWLAMLASDLPRSAELAAPWPQTSESVANMPIRCPSNSDRSRAPNRGADVPSKLARYSAAVVFLPLKPYGRGLGGVAARPVLRELYARKGAQGGRLLPAARGSARRDAARRRLPAAAGEHLRAAAGGRQDSRAR